MAVAAVAGPVQLRLQLDVFEGPLELLLSLIEQNRLPITQVSLAQVADQYLSYVHAQPHLAPDLLADFLAIGGKLLLMKSKALLLAEEPDEEVAETAAELEERLNTYRVYRAAAQVLQEMEARGLRSYPTQREPGGPSGLPPLLPIAPAALLAAMRRLTTVAAPVPASLDLPVRASVDEIRAAILDALREYPTVPFRAFAGATVDQVVAAFLAVLELFRRDHIELAQPEAFSELTIQRRTPTI